MASTSNVLDIFNTAWSVEDDALTSISIHDWVEVDTVPPQPHVEGGVDSHLCPICHEKLKISGLEYFALLKGDENHIFCQGTQKTTLEPL